MKAIGIDLGTTNSLAAMVVGGQAQVFRDAAGNGLLPSIIGYDVDGEALVGSGARALALEAPGAAIFSIKRLMGRTRDEAIALGFQGERLHQDGAVLRVEVGGRLRTPVELAAEILKSLATRAEEKLGEPVGRAVITVPAHFDDTQRQATRQAGKLAGLEVMRLLNEPTAAALAYGLDKQKEGCFAVFDLGGGTFDISILQLSNGIFEVLSTGGDTQLGGDDFDRMVALNIVAREGVDPTGLSATEVRRALDAAEALKRMLSESFQGQFRFETDLGQIIEVVLSRDQYTAMISPVLERVNAPVRQALLDARTRAEQLDGVVLVGGSTRSPMVQRHVAELFGRPPLVDIDPDEVVALGAASQADLLSLDSELRLVDGGDVLLLDVTPLSLGLETMGGIVEKIIPRCAQIPASRTQEFTTFKDGQDGMDIHVVQGERELVPDCRSLARFRLQGIPPGPAGQARVRVSFAIDADGILKVSAEELSSGVAQEVVVHPSHGLTDNEVETMLLASLENAEADVMARLLASSRVEAERVLTPLQKAVAMDIDLMTPPERASIEDAMAELRAAMAAEDHRTIQDLTDQLDEVSGGFAQRRMERALSRGLRDMSINELERDLKDAPVGGGEHH